MFRLHCDKLVNMTKLEHECGEGAPGQGPPVENECELEDMGKLHENLRQVISVLPNERADALLGDLDRLLDGHMASMDEVREPMRFAGHKCESKVGSRRETSDTVL